MTAGPGAGGPGGRREGLALCAIGVVVISPDALIVRSVDASAWTTVAWRGIFTAIGTVTLLLFLRPGPAHRARGSSTIRTAVEVADLR